MIVVNYEEVTWDVPTNSEHYVPLGSESHQDIEEVLLPENPVRNRIFFTKKFANRPEYRWEVKEVLCLGGAPQTYRVRLGKLAQIDKQHYLKNITEAQNKRARTVLYPWAIVEVEFGHSLAVGKATGYVGSNKRYVDTIQLYSMPKRRLAIVTQIIERTPEDLVQVIPISSRAPDANDAAVVEVTSALKNMVNYWKQSWAICRMIQTVTASRVIAPLVKVSPQLDARDTLFRAKVRGDVREDLKDALMHGVAAASRLITASDLVTEKDRNVKLAAQVAELEAKMQLFETYKKVAVDTGFTVEEMRQYVEDDATPQV